MAPMVIAAPHDERGLHPHKHLRQVEARLFERRAEVHAFGVRMEHIRRRARLRSTLHAHERVTQESPERGVLHRVVLDARHRTPDSDCVFCESTFAS